MQRPSASLGELLGACGVITLVRSLRKNEPPITIMTQNHMDGKFYLRIQLDSGSTDVMDQCTLTEGVLGAPFYKPFLKDPYIGAPIEIDGVTKTRTEVATTEEMLNYTCSRFDLRGTKMSATHAGPVTKVSIPMPNQSRPYSGLWNFLTGNRPVGIVTAVYYSAGRKETTEMYNQLIWVVDYDDQSPFAIEVTCF